MVTDICLAVRGLKKAYQTGTQTLTVFDELAFTVQRGEVVALLGSSGAGKSTLLNLLAGIDVPDQGQIEIDGIDIAALSEAKRTQWRRQKLGFVFQFFNLIPTLTALENLRLPLQLNGKDDAEGQQQAFELLSQVGIGNRANSFPEQLSGGEQQRLAICRALVHQPQLLLADEPTGNLDANTADQVLQLLLALLKQSHTTAIIVTHSRAVAERTDRILQLHDTQLRELSC